MSGTNAQASREQRAAERQRYRGRCSAATSGSERQVRRGTHQCASHLERSLTAASEIVGAA